MGMSSARGWGVRSTVHRRGVFFKNPTALDLWPKATIISVVLVITYRRRSPVAYRNGLMSPRRLQKFLFEALLRSQTAWENPSRATNPTRATHVGYQNFPDISKHRDHKCGSRFGSFVKLSG